MLFVLKFLPGTFFSERILGSVWIIYIIFYFLSIGNFLLSLDLCVTFSKC